MMNAVTVRMRKRHLRCVRAYVAGLIESIAATLDGTSLLIEWSVEMSRTAARSAVGENGMAGELRPRFRTR
jgi:hypothetical protein